MPVGTRQLRPRLLTPTIAPLSTRRALPHVTLSKALAGGPTRTITFPTTDLAFRVYLALSADLTASWLTWQWEDVTPYVRYADGITISTWRRDESARVTPGTGGLRFDNRDGRFSRRNPTGPYYGKLSRNTPIWVQVDAGSGFKDRLQQYVTEWPRRWNKALTDSTVPISTAGVLRRLGQGEVLKSPLRRAILASSPGLYWPLEESTDASIVASGLPAGVPLAIVGAVNLGTDAGPAGSLPLPGSLLDDAGYLWQAVSLTITTAYQVEFVLKVDPTASGGSLVSWQTPGDATLAFWNVSWIGDGSALQVDTTTTSPSAATTTTRLGAFDLDDGEFHHIVIAVAQSGADAVLTLYVDGALSTSTTVSTVTVCAPRNPVITKDSVAAPSLGPVSVGHLGFYASTADLTGHYQAMLGYAGEQAHVRAARVCDEEGIAFTSSSSRSVVMGAQPAATLLDILRECEDADRGSLYEVGFGLGYRATSERYNATVQMTLDFALGQVAEPPEPADDDQRLRNQWTATRSTGSRAIVSDSVSIAADGLYDDASTVNVQTDGQLANVASWNVHLGTVDEDRWPVLDLNLAAAPELIDTWCAMTFAGRLNASNPPDQGPPDIVDAILEGYSERLDQRSWIASMATSPSRPYEIHIVEATGNRGRVDNNSTLAADATDVATSLSVSSPSSLWVTGAVNFDLEVGGERVTVTNIAGASSPQTFTVTRSVNGVVKAQTTNTKVRLWRPGVYAL